MGTYYMMGDQRLFCQGYLLTKMEKDTSYVEVLMISSLHALILTVEKFGGSVIHGVFIVQNVERWAIDRENYLFFKILFIDSGITAW